MRKNPYRNKTAVALLFVQSCLLAAAKYLEGEERKQRILISEVPMRATCFVNPKCAVVTRRIAKARVERTFRNLNGRRLPV